MAYLSPEPSLFLASIVIIQLIWVVSQAMPLQEGFTTHLIHRDSPSSPLYDPRISQNYRSEQAIVRSMSRLQYFKSVLAEARNLSAPIMPSNGEYLMEIFIGTPPFKQLVIADTGSDITWTQCLPCENCFKQDQPFFDSRNSSTFQPVTCEQCREIGGGCSRTTGTCHYHLGYDGGESMSSGFLARETYTLGGTSIPDLIYGCAHDSQGAFLPDTAGIVGLGGGKLSLVGQIKNSIGGKFSYCLMSNHTMGATSKISFGLKAVVSGPGVVSTQLVSKWNFKTFYFVTLESISVGGNNNRIFFNGTSKSGKPAPIERGNIIIDSGTTLTYLPLEMYRNLEQAVKMGIKAKPIHNPKSRFNSTLCYKIEKQNFTAPKITIHFAGGADLELPWTSIFYMDGNNIGCLGFFPTQDLYIYGNLLQMDFLVGYDLQNGIVSFKPMDCSRE